jgi:hypothetical protein
MAERAELILQVPAEMTVKGSGLAMDMGMIAINVVRKICNYLPENLFSRLRLVCE